MMNPGNLQHFYATVLNSVHDGIWVTDTNDRLVFFNRSMEVIAGVTADDVLGLSLVEDFPPETTKHFLPHYMKAKETLEPVEYEAPVVTPMGRPTIQCGWLTPIVTDGDYDGMICTIRDVTEARKTKAELINAGERAQRFLDIAPAIILALDRKGNITLLNAEGSRLLDCGTENVIGRNWFDTFIQEDMRDDIRQVFRKLVNNEIENIEYYTNEVQTLDGRRRVMVHWHNTLILDDEGRIKGLLSSGLDISEKHKAEKRQQLLQAQLAQAQKMESIGRLAGGVAHDFNNMLNIILGHADLALEDLSTDNPLHEDLDAIRNAAQRSADLTRQLIAFARKQTIAPEVLDINKAIGSMLQMLTRLIGEEIRLVWKPAQTLETVCIDPVQIDQMLANLVVNSRDAIQGAGTITIATGMREPVSPETKIRHVVITISDTGCGMDEEVRSHIFEPFFTTKAIGEGSGLGLATTYGIVKQNGGTIEVESEVGHGTTISIQLPVVYGDGIASATDTSGATPLAGDDLTILLVEDEAAILDMSRRMMESLGYKVLTANSSLEAIRLADGYGEDIHLLVTDVVMPNLNGRELAERLKSTRPELKRLFISGYTADVIADHGVLDEGVNFLQKPFSKHELAMSINRVLKMSRPD
jgi:PAS domain S-box-containing protein